ncbi:MAG: glycosyltransferase family 10 [Methanosarcina sp.]
MGNELRIKLEGVYKIYIGFYNYNKIFNNNRMFNDPNAPIGDDLLYPFVYLGEYLVTNGHKINTIDMDDVKSFDAVVFLDFPTFKNRYFRQLVDDKFKNLYLLAFESEVIRSDNWDAKNHQYFKKIFTWNDDLVNEKKYLKYYWPNKIPINLDFDISKKIRLCTMIAGHKFNSHPLELYTERIKAIRWFEQNHPEDFDLYGVGWDKYCFKKPLSSLNYIKPLTRLLRPKYPSYKGIIKLKREVLQKYKFAICYENARDISGYITEKIFDCFFAGCVPVYWGAPNINEQIPADTFIDKKKFRTYEELYSYLRNMPDNEYLNYLGAIKDFVEGDRIHPFNAECFAETIVNEIVGEK